MKSFRKELWFHVPSRRALINITQQVEECLRQSEIKEGLVLVNAMHITASVFINPTSALYLPIWGKFLAFAAKSRVISRGAFRFGLK